MKNILFVVDENKMGGVNTVLEDILNNLDYTNKTVDLLILHDSGNGLKNLSKDVNIIYGGEFFNQIDKGIIEILKSKSIVKIFSKIWFIFLMKTMLINKKIVKERKKILNKNYDVEVAFKYGFCTLFTYLGNSKKKINWIHGDCKTNDPCIKYRNKYKKILKNYDVNVTLSQNIDKNFNEIYSCSHNSIIINNIIDDKKIKNDIKNIEYVPTDYIKFSTIGRLSKVKGYDSLIEAFNLLKKDELIDKVRLTIVGDGEEKDTLIKMVSDYDLSKYITFLGKKIPPYSYIFNSDCFILSSISEAYPVVIIESFITGIPVLSTQIASANEMIDKKYGIIVETSVEGIYQGIKEIIHDPQIILKMKKNLMNYHYHNDIIMKQIEELLNS